MSCCGDKRKRTYYDPYANTGLQGSSETRSAPEPPKPVYFMYYGETALTAKGVISGKVYRFEGTGSVVEVNANDATFMTGIPNIRRVRGN